MIQDIEIWGFSFGTIWDIEPMLHVLQWFMNSADTHSCPSLILFMLFPFSFVIIHQMPNHIIN